MSKEEIRAKALEIAVLILGGYNPGSFPPSSCKEIISRYQGLAEAIEKYIQESDRP